MNSKYFFLLLVMLGILDFAFLHDTRGYEASRNHEGLRPMCFKGRCYGKRDVETSKAKRKVLRENGFFGKGLVKDNTPPFYD